MTLHLLPQFPPYFSLPRIISNTLLFPKRRKQFNTPSTSPLVLLAPAPLSNLMALGDEKLSPNDPVSNLTDSCLHFCNSTITRGDNITGLCPPPCLVSCPLICLHPLLPHLLPPSPSSSSSSSYSPLISEPNKSHNLSPLLISMLILFASTFLIVCFYLIYLKFYSSSSFHSQTNRRRRRGRGITIRSTAPNNDRHRERNDGSLEDAPVHIVDLDHPIWYIATVGLQPSVIKSITVCKYNKSDGIIEGTDCAVCLTEFEDDDMLRLLPKCNHAFHINCIDTWLRSHKNCPLCRAPIVANSGQTVAAVSGIGDLRSISVGDSTNGNETVGGVEARIEVDAAEEEGGGLDGVVDDGGGRRELNKEKELGEVSAVMRRSVSMERRIDVQLVNDDEGSSSSGGQGTRGSSTSSMRWLVGPRSLSCSGKIFSSRYSKGG